MAKARGGSEPGAGESVESAMTPSWPARPAGVGQLTFSVLRGGAWRPHISANYAGCVSGLWNWWDSVELWVTGLPFVPQVAVVMVVLVPLAALLARALDVLLAGLFRWFGRDKQVAVTSPDQESETVEVEN